MIPFLAFVFTGCVKFVGYSLFTTTFFRHYKTESLPPPQLNEDGAIDEDRYCVMCDYNVRGLRPEGKCPECGTPIPAIPPTRALKYRQHAPELLRFALTRTLAGLVIGGLYWSAVPKDAPFLLWAWVCLAPIRVIEWLVVAGMFRRCFIDRKQVVELTFVGTAWSYVLDIPVILGVCAYYGGPC